MSRAKLSALTAALAIFAVLVAGGVLAGYARGERMTIEVEGVTTSVQTGLTVSEVLRTLDLEVAHGDLLDIRGRVLQPGVFPGRILLNGRPARPAAVVVGGDSLELVAGRSRREPVDRVTTVLAEGIAANPQRTLERSRRVAVDRGRISGELDLRTATPLGPWRKPKAVALTFDDGPSRHTRDVLEVLRRMKVPATFFVVGTYVNRHPGVVRRAHAYGMAVENHSYAHPYRPPFAEQRPVVIRDEIVRGADAIAPLAGSPKLFRPPGGTVSPRVVDVARAHGQRVALWSVDPEDWRPGLSAAEITARVLRDVRRGSIVLLHDGGGNRSQTVKALPAIVKGIRARGFELVLIEPRKTG